MHLTWTIYRRHSSAVLVREASGSDPVLSLESALETWHTRIAQRLNRSLDSLPPVYHNPQHTAWACYDDGSDASGLIFDATLQSLDKGA